MSGKWTARHALPRLEVPETPASLGPPLGAPPAPGAPPVPDTPPRASVRGALRRWVPRWWHGLVLAAVCAALALALRHGWLHPAWRGGQRALVEEVEALLGSGSASAQAREAPRAAERSESGAAGPAPAAATSPEEKAAWIGFAGMVAVALIGLYAQRRKA